MKILVREKISPHRMKTPEGYLVCSDVILARTGIQQYKKCELFADADNTVIDVDREESEVFSETTLASFENKPLTIQHPDEDVTVENHKELAYGYVRDIRKGYENGSPVMRANIVITDKEAIEAVENGMQELSCGYDCDIVEENGKYYQRNIRGNHVALCECGRAGNARIIDSANDEPIADSIVKGIIYSSDHDLATGTFGNETTEEVGNGVYVTYWTDGSQHNNHTSSDMIRPYFWSSSYAGAKLDTYDLDRLGVYSRYKSELIKISKKNLIDGMENKMKDGQIEEKLKAEVKRRFEEEKHFSDKSAKITENGFAFEIVRENGKKLTYRAGEGFVFDSCEDELVDPSSEDISKFEDLLRRNEIKIERKGKTWSGRIHYQVLYNGSDRELFQKLNLIDDQMERIGIPTTYSVGYNPQTKQASAGIDLDKKSVKDSCEEKIEDASEPKLKWFEIEFSENKDLAKLRGKKFTESDLAAFNREAIRAAMGFEGKGYDKVYIDFYFDIDGHTYKYHGARADLTSDVQSGLISKNDIAEAASHVKKAIEGGNKWGITKVDSAMNRAGDSCDKKYTVETKDSSGATHIYKVSADNISDAIRKIKDSVEIWMNGKKLERAANVEAAKSRVARYEREDKYERDVEKYGFPNGMPSYEIKVVSNGKSETIYKTNNG